MRRMGHSSITVTYDTYGHLFPERDVEITDALDGLFQRGVDFLGTRPASRVASEASASPLTCTFSSALGGIRTPNLLIRSQMLYPLSYQRRKMGSDLRFCLRSPVALPGTALQQHMSRHLF